VTAVALRLTTPEFVVAIREPSESARCKRLLGGDAVTLPEHNPKFTRESFQQLGFAAAVLALCFRA
jgi:hypothetical protein